jgi:hypothetical protein
MAERNGGGPTSLYVDNIAKCGRVTGLVDSHTVVCYEVGNHAVVNHMKK